MLAISEPSPFTIAATPRFPEALKALDLKMDMLPRGRDSSGGAPGLLRIKGTPLADRSRIGDLFSRQMTDFPVEIDRPPRLTNPIEVPYPATALAQGREETVVAWVIVNEKGSAETIEIAEGSEEFAQVVRTALMAASFEPARNNRLPISFPISLEFRFTTPTQAQDANLSARTKQNGGVPIKP